MKLNLNHHKESNLYWWKAEGADALQDQEFIAFQGKIKSWYPTYDKVYITFHPGTIVTYRPFKAVKQHTTREELTVEVSRPPETFKEEEYVLNSLNPTPVLLSKLEAQYEEDRKKALAYDQWLKEQQALKQSATRHEPSTSERQ